MKTLEPAKRRGRKAKERTACGNAIKHAGDTAKIKEKSKMQQASKQCCESSLDLVNI